MDATIQFRAQIAHPTRRQAERWRTNGKPRKHILRLMTRDANRMAIRDRRLTFSAAPVSKGTGCRRPQNSRSRLSEGFSGSRPEWVKLCRRATFALCHAPIAAQGGHDATSVSGQLQKSPPIAQLHAAISVNWLERPRLPPVIGITICNYSIL